MSLNMKTYLMVGAAVLGLSFAPQAHAQTTVNVDITTDAGITVVDGTDIGFGTWFLVFRNADPFTLVMPADTGIAAAAGLGGGATDSLATKLTAVDQFGSMTVELPVGVSGIQMNMTRTAATAFADPGITVSQVTYYTATQNTAGGTVFPTPASVPVTVVTGGTPETVQFGATIAVSATPADGTYQSSFDVSFNF